jgi:DNA repair protein RadC
MEIAMNLSALSREALVDQFFCTAACPLPDTHPLARDGTPDSLQPREGQLHQLLGLAKELLLRDLQRDLSEAPLMDRPQSLRDWLKLRFSGLDHEVFLVVFLDTQHRLLDAEVMFRGTLAQTTVYPREVVKAALARNAAAVAFAHNHPSGEPEPSRADEALTATLKSALMLVDVRVIDHFVVAGNKFLSMAERGLI